MKTLDNFQPPLFAKQHNVAAGEQNFADFRVFGQGVDDFVKFDVA